MAAGLDVDAGATEPCAAGLDDGLVAFESSCDAEHPPTTATTAIVAPIPTIRVRFTDAYFMALLAKYARPDVTRLGSVCPVVVSSTAPRQPNHSVE